MNNKLMRIVWGGLFILLFAGLASANELVTVVSGTVSDHATNSPVSGASVTVICNGITQTSQITSSNGKYSVTYNSGCTDLDTVNVYASKGNSHGEAHGTVHDLSDVINVAIVPVTISVPEFASAAVAVLISMGSLGIIYIKRSRED
jgi:hypothetical protein